MGPEAEFFVFDDVRFDQSQGNAGFYFIDSIEGALELRRARSVRTSDTRSVRRRATSPSRRPTRSRTCARR